MKQKQMSGEWLVNGNIWTVKFKREIKDTATTHCLGLCDPSDRMIYIKLGQSFEERLDSFFHEFLHSAEEEYDFELDHKDVHKLARAMARFYIDNF